jgi:hypothetical protein
MSSLTIEWSAAHLALRSPRRLRFDFLAHRDASNTELPAHTVIEARDRSRVASPGCVAARPRGYC